MKVMCINDKDWKPPYCPVFGEIYTVNKTTSQVFKGKRYYFYHLEETLDDFGFWVERFALISNIEETAISENSKTLELV